MDIVYSKSALKFLSRLDRKSVERIQTAIERLTHTPPKGDIKIMKGFDDGRRRLRIGSWRVIYRIEPTGKLEVLLVLDIGNRGDIYK